MGETGNTGAAQPGVLEGKISISGKGLGFLEVEGSEKDAVVETKNLAGAFHGDTVRWQLLGGTDRFDSPLAKVVSIASRAKTRFAANVEILPSHKVGLPKPPKSDFVAGEPTLIGAADDRRVYVPFLFDQADAGQVREGDKVFVELADWQPGAKGPRVRLLERVGKKGENDAEMRAIALERGFATGHPAACEEEAKALKEANSPMPADEITKRRDCRGIPLFTIDPKTAKDFDDAISLRPINGDRYELGVHIADVSHFVAPGSALDREAIDRQCSVYLVDRTIPMLPETLSNDLCSINPDEDKFAFSAIFEVDTEGQVISEWFGRTVIRSLKRFTYEDAQDVIDGKAPGPYRDELLTLSRWAKQMQKENAKEGAISFERDEYVFELDDRGIPISVSRKPRLDTHKLVEEFMLLANRHVARFIEAHDEETNGGKALGRMYRVHDVPDKEKIKNLQAFVHALGYKLTVDADGDVSQKDIGALLTAVTGKPEEMLVKTAAVRTMAKAIYSIENSGHYGLAFDYYTHFTSPIRRYPDLVVHRILAASLEGKRFSEAQVGDFARVAARATEREVQASEAERASIRYKQVEFMQAHVGATFEGVVSGVAKWGAFVTIEETGAEGMVHISKLGGPGKADFFSLDEKNYRLVGEKSGKKISLGDRVRVKVEKADMEEKKLDLALV